MERVTVRGDKFVDGAGREVLLQGINFVCKEKDKGYLWPEHKRLFAWFAQSGFNLIRLGIFWDGVEPEPGKYDQAYLDKIKGVIEDAREQGLYVLVDMHQDLWSVLYADGAPEWATLTDGAEHPTDCAMWFDAYLRSEAIINAADHFWKNDPAADGRGLMDHYEAMWERIAQALGGCSNVIGFEPMNEPFMGSLARNAFGAAAMETQQKYPEFDFQKMAGITQESQAYFMGLVGGKFLVFDRETLMPFYERMNRAIRKYSHIPLATGGNIYCSSSFPTGLERVGREDGGKEPLQIYAPHGYDSVVDSDRYESFSRENVERLFADKRATQERLGMPVLVGEWGAFPSKDFTNELIDHMNGILEKYHWSSAYWQYLPGMETDAHFSALRRGYPAVTEGELVRYHYDRDCGKLEVAWIGESVLCYLPFTEYRIEAEDAEAVLDSSLESGVWVKLTSHAPVREAAACIVQDKAF